MLQYLINKYKKDDIAEVVYRLSYGGKFLIVKGKTLSGSLYLIQKGYKNYYPITAKEVGNELIQKDRLYYPLYNHYNWVYAAGKRTRWTVKVIANTSLECSQYDLLVAEQTALDAARSSPDFIGASFSAYIPKLVQSTGDYRWLSKEAVMAFERYLSSRTSGQIYVNQSIGAPSPEKWYDFERVKLEQNWKAGQLEELKEHFKKVGR